MSFFDAMGANGGAFFDGKSGSLLGGVTVLAFFVLATVEAADPKGVNVQLRAKWHGTSLLLEAGELLATERPQQYWQWLDQVVGTTTSSTDEQCVALITQAATAGLSIHLAAVLRLSLALRLASPKLVLYRQIAKESLIRHGLLQQTEEDSISKIDDRWRVNDVPPSVKGSCCWIEAGGKLVFRVADALAAVEQIIEQSEPQVYDFDHVHPDSPKQGPLVILYGAVGTPCFKELYKVLVEAVGNKKFRLVHRPVLPQGCQADRCASLGEGTPVTLGGYGVELALKNMEYKAIDDSELKKGGADEAATLKEDLSQDVRGFLFQKLIERKPDKATELLTFREHLLSSGAVDEKINVWDLKDIGLQAAQRIALASEPLRLMQDISQNFPNVASPLSRMQLNSSITDEIAANQKMVQAGRNLLAVNGAVVNDLENLDLFSLLAVVKQEVVLGEQLAKLKLPPESIRQLLRVPDPQADPSLVRIDVRSDEHVHYINDLEKDARYRSWRSSLQELMMPTFPGQLRQIRRNLFNIVYVVDPASAHALRVFESIYHYYENMVPLRFGVLLASPPQSPAEDISSQLIQTFLYLNGSFDTQTAFRFLASLPEHVNHLPEDSPTEKVVTFEALEAALAAVLKSKRSRVKTEAIIGLIKEDPSIAQRAKDSTSFVLKKGLSGLVPCMLMNGRISTETSLQESLLENVQTETQWLQREVYFGRLKGSVNALDYALGVEGYPRYSPLVLDDSRGQYVALADWLAEHPGGVKYLYPPGGEDDVKPVTHWVVADLGSERGIQLVKEALKRLLDPTCDKARVGVVSWGEGGGVLARAVLAASEASSRRAKVVPFLLGFLQSQPSPADPVSSAVAAAKEAGLRADELERKLSTPEEISRAEQILQDQQRLSEEVLGLEPGEAAVVTNGRVLRIGPGANFTAEDFELLEKVEWEDRAKPVMAIVEKSEWRGVGPDDLSAEFLSTALMSASSSVAARTRGEMSTANFGLLKDRHSAIVTAGTPDTPVEIEAIIDPLCTTAQRLSALLLTLQSWLKPKIRIVLNPRTSLADLPIKSFYRFAAPDNKRAFAAAPAAAFSHLPPQRTLTLNVDAPEPWLVEPVEALHDLDNLRLEKLGDSRTLQAVYELEAVMLTGHIFEERSREPPRGMQLLLGGKEHPHMVDTTVMANLGYFQLKSAPGIWNLALAPGRSRDLYTMKPEKGSSSEAEPVVSREVVMGDFLGKILRMEVRKRPGKESEQILQVDKANPDSEGEEVPGGGASLVEKIAGAAGRWLGSKKAAANQKSALATPSDETINIFSVASGHLYERFLKIMILSVLKHTKRPVKFWFIKNYLSPRFKHFIPHMAAEYGFEYELVTYKWPSWLNKQTEKQRIIWAYKILFLDVLFPLNLKKVIFVDADQIVRTDMGQLYDMDLQGAPLAYTPFCDNNREMDGFRFWKQGFWKDHLRGKPYHISALYVVDLVRLRLLAAGDHLRVFYESLSKDPNSLANLDQDLPNYAQHMVPIFSLPQEWLWCESWCGNATKAQAKTIDLCNNPMTKEPKLEGARRIVAEWPAYDEEARRLTERVEGRASADLRLRESSVPNVGLTSERDLESKVGDSNSGLKDEL